MAFREILDGLAKLYPHGTSARYRLLDAYEKVRDSKLYEHLAYPFAQERDGDYIPMMQRRPSVIYPLATIVVNQCCSLLFGDEHAPTVRCWTKDTDENPYERVEQAAERIIDELDIESHMSDAVFDGSVGSVAIVVRAVGYEKTPYFEIVPGKHYRPIYDSLNPLKLLSIVQIYPTTAQALLDIGYTIAELCDADQKPEDIRMERVYWMRIEIDAREERRFVPLSNERYQRLGEKDPFGNYVVRWIIDEARSFGHAFGCVPVIDIVQGKKTGIDGQCTFGLVVDTCIEIDYLLSQIGRGIRYAGDPLLVIERGELANQNITGPIGEETVKGPDGGIAKTSSNVITLEAGAKAQLLEITGKAVEAGGEHVSKLREYALEAMSGMKSESQHEKGVQSGKALDKLWECLKLLIKRLRVPYGNRGLIPLLRLIMQGIQVGAIVVDGVDPSDVDPKAPFRLIRPQMALPEGADLFATAEALTLLAGASRSEGKRLVDDDTLTRLAAAHLGITDANAAVKARQKADTQDDADEEASAQRELDHQIKINAAKPVPKPPASGKAKTK